MVALFVVMWVDARVRVDAGAIARVLWFAWFIMLVWMVFQIAQWRHDRFIATDKRLLLDYGLITKKIAMMPFIKVTDMSYHRTVPGRIFGYGEFILESAGQEQALRKVEWVPHPDATYRIICAEIFGLPNSPADRRLRPGRRVPRRRHRRCARLRGSAGRQPAGADQQPRRYAYRRVRGRGALVLLAGHPAAPARRLVPDPER